MHTLYFIVAGILVTRSGARHSPAPSLLHRLWAERQNGVGFPCYGLFYGLFQNWDVDAFPWERWQ